MGPLGFLPGALPSCWGTITGIPEDSLSQLSQPMPTVGGEDVAPALKERFGKYVDERTERGA